MPISSATVVCVSKHTRLDGHFDELLLSREDEHLSSRGMKDEHLSSQGDDHLDVHLSSPGAIHLDVHLLGHRSNRIRALSFG